MLTNFTHEMPIHEGTRSQRLGRPSRMPLTGTLVVLYVAAVVLFAESPTTSTIATVIGLTLAVVFAVELTGRSQRVCFPVPFVWFLLFLCFCLLQANWLPGSVARIMTLFQLLVLSFILINFVSFYGGTRYVATAMYAVVPLTFLYTIYFHPDPVDGRVASTLLNANSYAYVLMFGAIFAIRSILLSSVAGKFRSPKGVLLFAYIALCLYGIIFLTGSRKGIMFTLAAGAGLALYWVWRQPIRRRPLIIAAMAVVFVLVGYALYRSPQFSRVIDLSNYFAGRDVVDTGLVKRSHLYKDAIALWLQRPFGGWGLDQFSAVSGWSTYSHSNYLELLVNHGVVGILTYFMIYVSAFVSILRSYLSSGDPLVSTELFWAMTVLGVLVAWDVAAVSYYSKMSWIILSVVVGVSARSRIEGWRDAAQ